MMSLSSRSVTGALPGGQTTRAFFQSGSVNGGLSGSSAAARSISSSVIAARRVQSVSLFILRACFSETRVICSSVISSCPSGADDPTALAAPCVRDLNYVVTQRADGPVPLLAVVPPPILGLDELAGEDLNCVDEVDAVLEDVGVALRLVP